MMREYSVVVAIVLALCLQNVLAIDLGTNICIFAKLCKTKLKNCPKTCPEFEDFLCGTDGRSYQNDCFLKRANCERETRVSIAYKLACSKYEALEQTQSLASETMQNSDSKQTETRVPKRPLQRRVLPIKVFD